jgi:hypothetical protein
VADFNNDMLPDIFVVRSNITDLDYCGYINSGGSFSMFEGVISSAKGYSMVSPADYNVDGKVDLALISSSTYLFTNLFNTTRDSNWIIIELFSFERGTMRGSTVSVIANGILQKQVALGSHSRLHFGLGAAKFVSQIIVSWNFGGTNINRFYGYKANQLVTFLTHQAFSNDHQLEVLSSRPPPNLQCDDGFHRLMPSFFILGVWKAGTSSLAYTLGRHPQIYESARKELYFFNSYYPQLSFEWYTSQFPCSNVSNSITFEATAGYLF